MSQYIERRLLTGFVALHILHHAEKEPLYGAWMLEELEEHGYEMSPGTLYPIFHHLEKDGLLVSEKQVVEGKTRKYYQITDKGRQDLIGARKKLTELVEEVLPKERG